MRFDKDIIKQSITIEMMVNLLEELGAEPQLQGDVIICKTICHHGDSHKLYYYSNSKLFVCYTQCGDSFDIFDLIIRVFKNKELTLFDSMMFVVDFFRFGVTFNSDGEEGDTSSDWQIIKEKLRESPSFQTENNLKIYDTLILNNLPYFRIKNWEEEDIKTQISKVRGIKIDPLKNCIIIPHYDKDNNLIGIRQRTLIKENEKWGKYKPAILNSTMYNHPLGKNLYNLNNSKNNIKVFKKAIIFESEKSCLKYASYFGEDNDISVAVCGSNLTIDQVQLLLECEAEEICLAFDRQFKEEGDEEYVGWIKKLYNFYYKYGSLIQISFLFDTNGLLGYKDSPIDCGKETFLKLFNDRFYIDKPIMEDFK